MILVLRKNLRFHDVFERDCTLRVHVLDDPIEGLQVAQTTFAFFDIWLNDIARIALARVAIVALLELI